MQKKYNPEQTVAKILSISTELFNEKGYDKTSMQDIVNALGMSKGAIFHHFKSKEDILGAVLKIMADEQMAAYKSQIQNEMKGLTAKEKLTSVMSASISIDTNKVADAITKGINDPKIVMGMLKYNMEISAPFMASILRDGIADGSIKTDYPDECAEVLILLLNIWCDPMVLKCSLNAYRKRLKYLQHIMAASGVDVITDEFIEKDIKFVESLYEVKTWQ